MFYRKHLQTTYTKNQLLNFTVTKSKILKASFTRINISLFGKYLIEVKQAVYFQPVIAYWQIARLTS